MPLTLSFKFGRGFVLVYPDGREVRVLVERDHYEDPEHVTLRVDTSDDTDVHVALTGKKGKPADKS